MLDFATDTIENVPAGGQALTLVRPAIGPTDEMKALLLTDGLLHGALRGVTALFRSFRSSGAAGGSIEEWASAHTGELESLISEVAIPVLRDVAGPVAVIALDHAANRKALAKDAEWCSVYGDPLALVEVPGQDRLPKWQRVRYSPALRAWAMECVYGDEAFSIAIQTLRLFRWADVGKAIGALLQITPVSAPVTIQGETVAMEPTSTLQATQTKEPAELALI